MTCLHQEIYLLCQTLIYKPQFDARASTSTLRSVFHRQSFTQMLTSETPPTVRASMERGVAATLASSIALTEGLVTPDHERAPVVDEHHGYLYAAELQKSLERRSSGRT
ncbi:hypothetical protein SUGI_1173560 [Cryptomeria japonica]|nr:hypothetical protein SUGI_1173560 [Cryptomeria japonica]